MQLRIADVIDESVVDGPGLRMTIFTQGCFHDCPGCHNPQTHDPDGGQLVDIADLAAMAKDNPLLSGVTFSGGEPFLQPEALAELADMLKPDLDIICYTGYTYEQLLKKPDAMRLLEKIDILVDGPFVMAKRNLELPFRGSENQRPINVPESLRLGRVVPAWEPEKPAGSTPHPYRGVCPR